MSDSSFENRRQWIHFAMVLFCPLLRYLEWWQAAMMALLAVVFNALVLPLLKVGREITRESDPFFSGIKFYPFAVLLAILLFPMPVAAAAWGVLAAGDCFSNVVGRAYGRTKLPWNPGKSIAGSLAFVLTAFPVAWFLAWWTALGHPGASLEGGAAASLAAAGAITGALVESLPIRIDDNLSVTLSSGLVMALLVWAYVG